MGNVELGSGFSVIVKSSFSSAGTSKSGKARVDAMIKFTMKN